MGGVGVGPSDGHAQGLRGVALCGCHGVLGLGLQHWPCEWLHYVVMVGQLAQNGDVKQRRGFTPVFTGGLTQRLEEVGVLLGGGVTQNRAGIRVREPVGAVGGTG